MILMVLISNELLVSRLDFYIIMMIYGQNDFYIGCKV